MRNSIGCLIIFASMGLGQNWEMTPIFPETLETYGADIVTDSLCLPHVAFNRDRHGLEYASWTGDSWSFECLASGYGRGLDLCLDRNDNPHIGYVWSPHNPEEVRHACREGDSWHIETAAEGCVQGWLKFGGLELARDGTPHMVFVDSATVKYAYKSTDTWIVITVPAYPADPLRHLEGVSLALDTSNRPGIAVGWWDERGRVDSLWLSFFEYDGEDWHRFEVDSAGGWAPYEFSAPRVRSDPATDLFHIVYRSGAYATGKGGNWQVEETGYTDAKSRDFVLYQGQPHIVVSGCDCFMQYTWRTAEGWETEMVGDFLFTWQCPAKVAVDRTGRPHLTFDSSEDGILYYARRLGAGTEEPAPAIVQPKLQLLVRPNPAFGDFTVQYGVPVKGRVRLTLCDIQGRVERVIRDGDLNPGYYRDAFKKDARSVPAGVHFLVLAQNGKRLTRKLVLME